MLGPLRPHVHLRLLRERQGCVSETKNGERLLHLNESNMLLENIVIMVKKGRKLIM